MKEKAKKGNAPLNNDEKTLYRNFSEVILDIKWSNCSGGILT